MTHRRFLSVCSGIEAASVAWRRLGWQTAALAEIAPFPSAVLAYHYPKVPNLGDFTTITRDRLDDLGPVQLLVGGTPCQSFSVAGLRRGLDDPRGNLALAFLRLAHLARPRWVVWENVPGVLSSNRGRDFGAFLGALGQLGYGFAYRVLDAQYFGVAQRRRRVFVVGCLGDWRAAAAVLFERDCLSGHPAPRRQAGARVAGTLEARAGSRGFDPGAGGAAAWHLVPQAFGGGNCSGPVTVSTALTAHGTRLDFDTETFIAHTLRADGFDASEDGTGRGAPLVPVAFQCQGGNVGPMGTLRSGRGGVTSGVPFLAAPLPFDTTQVTSAVNRSNPRPGDPCHPLAARAHVPAIAFSCKDHGADAGPLAPTLRSMGHDASHANGGGQVAVLSRMAVRRITPREAERLQGFPDDYTAIPWRGKSAPLCPDGPRYHALGNSMAVPVMRWIGERIDAVSKLMEAA